MSNKAVIPIESPPIANQLAKDEKLPLFGENKYRKAILIHRSMKNI